MPAEPRISRLALSYWLGGNRLQAWALTFLVIACTVILVVLNMLLNKWQASFYDCLQQYDLPGFIKSLLQFLGFSAIFVMASGYQSYLRMQLNIRWRRWLTDKYIDMWLRNLTYYQLNLAGSAPNPEQHISEDIQLFVTHSLDLTAGLLRHLVALLVFSAILWQLSGVVTFAAAHYTVHLPGYLFWLALLYSIAGTWLTVRIGRPLFGHNIRQQTHEAEFRSYLGRIKEHDESVALYQGEVTERRSLICHFQEIMRNYRRIIESTRSVTLVSAAYMQISVVFAFLAASPRYFSHEIQLGQLFEISGAYWYVHSALSYLIDSFGTFVRWKAVACRLETFSRKMYEVRHSTNPCGVITYTPKNHLKLRNLTIWSQSNQPVLKNLTLDLQPQDRLLISGPAGCGKTTLIRAIAGVWPYLTGTIIKPENHTMLFLPQKPYIPPGSLRAALLYPVPVLAASDTRLYEILDICRLSRLIGYLDKADDWGKIMSLGEQQCLSFARALLRRPAWLFLDEATASLDQQTERRLYLSL